MSLRGFAVVSGSVLALAGLAATLVPLPRTVRCEYELVAVEQVPVAAPFFGLLQQVAPAGPVDAGATLAVYDPAQFRDQRAQLETQRALLVKRLESPTAPELLAAVTEAEQRLARERENLRTAKPKFKPYMQAVVHGAEVKLAEAREAAKPVPSAQLEEPLAQLNAQLAALDEQQAASVLSAPNTGRFTPEVKAGENVTPKQRIGVVIDASTLEARVTLPEGEIAKQGRLLTLVFPLARKTWALERDGAIAIELDNRDGALKPGARGACELEGEPAPLINRLVAPQKTR